MRRAEFLALTAFHDDRFKSWCRRGLIRFATPTSDSKWARIQYSPLRAFLLVATDQLVEAGLNAEVASNALLGREVVIARGPLVILPVEGKKGESRGGPGGFRLVLPTDDERNDIWAGWTKAADHDQPEFFFNTLTEIAEDIHSGFGTVPNGLFLTNLTEAVRTVRRRANELGDPDLTAELGLGPNGWETHSHKQMYLRCKSQQT